MMVLKKEGQHGPTSGRWQGHERMQGPVLCRPLPPPRNATDLGVRKPSAHAAELTALYYLLLSATTMDNLPPSLVMVGDNSNALNLATGSQEPKKHHALVRAIRELWETLSQRHTLRDQWTPGHSGLEGNEAVDAGATLALKGEFQLRATPLWALDHTILYGHMLPESVPLPVLTPETQPPMDPHQEVLRKWQHVPLGPSLGHPDTALWREARNRQHEADWASVPITISAPPHAPLEITPSLSQQSNAQHNPGHTRATGDRYAAAPPPQLLTLVSVILSGPRGEEHKEIYRSTSSQGTREEWNRLESILRSRFLPPPLSSTPSPTLTMWVVSYCNGIGGAELALNLAILTLV